VGLFFLLRKYAFASQFFYIRDFVVKSLASEFTYLSVKGGVHLSMFPTRDGANIDAITATAVRLTLIGAAYPMVFASLKRPQMAVEEVANSPRDGGRPDSRDVSVVSLL